MEYSPTPERVQDEDFEYITIPSQIEELEPEPDSAGDTIMPRRSQHQSHPPNRYGDFSLLLIHEDI